MVERRFIWWIGVVCLSGALSFLFQQTPLGERLELLLWDLRVQLTADSDRAGRDDVKLIVITQSSLEEVERQYGYTWPWPRSIYEPVIEYLKQAKVNSIGFDLLFTESSVHSVDEDRALAAASKGAPPTVHVLAGSHAKKRTEDELAWEKFRSWQTVHGAQLSEAVQGIQLDSYPEATLPVPELLEPTASLAIVSVQPDEDGIFRRIAPGYLVAGSPVFSLPVAMQSVAGEDLVLRELPVDSDGRLILRFHGGIGTYELFNFVDVLQSALQEREGGNPTVERPSFSGSHVLIGAWAPALYDLRPTSLERDQYRGVEFNATALDNLIHRDFIRQLPQSTSALWGLIVISLVSAGALYPRRASSTVMSVAAVGVAYFVGALLAAHSGVWIEIAPWAFGSVLAVVSIFFLRYQLEGKQKQFLRKAFSQYLSPSVIEQVVSDPDKLRLGGERRELTILFSDLAGFTSISERLDPEELVRLLNRYLGGMTDIILEEGGTLDKYEGDAIIAFWNAPLEQEDHADRALRAARRSVELLGELNQEFQREFDLTLSMRVGIHTGVVTVGNFGSSSRFDYTIIGDAANLASRIEGVNKVFGTSVLFSQATQERLKSPHPYREIGDVRVVGRNEPVKLFEPGVRSEEESWESFQQARQLFESGKLKESLAKFEELSDDPVAQAYTKRLSTIESSDSVWRLESK